MLKTSVVLASHNGEKYIRQQLESLTGQTLLPAEIVISDDASIDGTREIVSEFVKSSPVAVIFRENQEALGFRENFLTAVNLASGDLIAFSDQDDVWHPEKLAICNQFFEDPLNVLVSHKARLIDAHGSDIGSFDQGILSTEVKRPLSMDPWGVFFGFSIVFRRSLFQTISFERRGLDYILGIGGLSHDRWIYYLANLLGNVVTIDAYLAGYRQHSTNLFGARPSRTKGSRLSYVRQRAALYIQAATHLRGIIPEINPNGFPLFNFRRADGFWMSTLKQQKARYELYDAGSKIAALDAFFRNNMGGVYRNIHDDRWRWRSWALDFRILLQHLYET